MTGDTGDMAEVLEREWEWVPWKNIEKEEPT